MENVEKVKLDFVVLKNGMTYPIITNAKEKIETICQKRLRQLYGNKVSKEILKRYNYELNSIINNKYESSYLIAWYISNKARQDGQFWYLKGSASSSFVVYLLGISYINPLEYNLHFEEFSGLNGDKKLDFCFVFAQEYREKVVEYLKSYLGENHIYTLWESLNKEKIRQTLQNNPSLVSNKSNKTLEDFMSRLNTFIGWYSNVRIIQSEEKVYENVWNEYCNAEDNEIIDNIFKDATGKNYLNITLQGTGILSNFNKLQNATQTNFDVIDIRDEKILKLFNTDAKGRVRTNGLPYFHAKYSKNIIRKVKPKNILELISVTALIYCTNGWYGNNEYLIEEHNITELACSREDVYDLLKSKGIGKKVAFEISQLVVKRNWKEGNAKWEKYIEIMLKHNVPAWYMFSLEKIDYMFSKAQACNILLINLMFGWYKVYYPKEFKKVYE